MPPTQATTQLSSRRETDVVVATTPLPEQDVLWGLEIKRDKKSTKMQFEPKLVKARADWTSKDGLEAGKPGERAEGEKPDHSKPRGERRKDRNPIFGKIRTWILPYERRRLKREKAKKYVDCPPGMTMELIHEPVDVWKPHQEGVLRKATETYPELFRTEPLRKPTKPTEGWQTGLELMDRYLCFGAQLSPSRTCSASTSGSQPAEAARNALATQEGLRSPTWQTQAKLQRAAHNAQASSQSSASQRQRKLQEEQTSRHTTAPDNSDRHFQEWLDGNFAPREKLNKINHEHSEDCEKWVDRNVNKPRILSSKRQGKLHVERSTMSDHIALWTARGPAQGNETDVRPGSVGSGPRRQSSRVMATETPVLGDDVVWGWLESLPDVSEMKPADEKGEDLVEEPDAWPSAWKNLSS